MIDQNGSDSDLVEARHGGCTQMADLCLELISSAFVVAPCEFQKLFNGFRDERRD